MAWHLGVSNWLAHAAVGGTLILGVGFVAVLLCRQPIRRIRLIELTLLGAVAVPVLNQAPWLPRWWTGLLPFSSSERRSPEIEVPPSQPAAAASDVFMAAPLAQAPADQTNTALPSAALPANEAPTPAVSLAALIALAYGLIVTAFLAWYGAGVLRLVWLYRSTYAVPGHVLDIFRIISGPRGHAVAVRASDQVELPIAFRGWRPVIVLPASLCHDSDNAALRFGLAHEWSHIEGGDVSRWYWTSLVQILYFFNPLFWWLRRQLRLCQDYLADARAAEHARQAEDYAAYLVALARRRLTPPAATLGIGDRRSNLYRRIVMLLQSPQSLERRCVKTWTAGTIVGGLAVLCLCCAIRLEAGAADEKSPLPGKADKAQARDVLIKKDPTSGKEPSQAPDKAEMLHYTGRVFDKDTGKSIAGAIVTVRRSLLGDPQLKDANPIVEETKHKTDADGKYRFTIPPEQTSKRYLYIELDVEHPDYAPRAHFGYALSMIRKNEKLGSRPFFENVEMRPGKAITGTLRTPDGQAAAGVKVQAYSVTNNRQDRFEYGSFTDCRTDANGQFRLVVTTPGAAVVWLLPEDFVPSTHRVPDAKRGDLGTFTLGPGISIKGKVLDVRGKPLAGVNVNAERRDRGEELQDLMVADMINRSAVTNEQGEFTMKPLPPGEYDIQPSDHARDGSGPRDKRHEIPGVFLRQRVALKGDTPPLEVRAVPHVVIEAQYYDSKGKKSRGHAGHIFGQLDKTYWFGQTKVDADGKMTAIVPHGLENVRLSLMTNEHGALRFRRTKNEPFGAGREVNLGTLNDDVRDIEIVHYKAPILVIDAVDSEKRQIKGFKAQVVYAEGKNKLKAGESFVNGVKGDVYLEKQEDGRWHSSQLLPDEALTITASAENYLPKSLQLSLPEGEVREVQLVLEKAPEKK
jgi:beta-lactamase regulating signal transducer with metallopeptidase domain/protocatechuate 3,4-dioxygenase beta subunit